MTAELFRDDHGIPHLRADSVIELARLQGRTAALDRAWQLDWNRRRAEGRTAEAIGRPGLIFDRFARQAQIDATARRCFDNLDQETRDWVAAFVDGVNSGLRDGSAEYEFVELGIEPGHWQPWTPLAVFCVQQLLFGGFAYKLWRRHVADRLGRAAVELLDPEQVDPAGSNAWAVAGGRTASGFPMIAGDPHRTADFPGVYQQVRLACAEFDVFGFTFPGVPGIQHFGHAGSVAWGITNAMADYQDLYLEELSRDGDQLTARGPEGNEPVSRSQELIMVREGDPEPVQIIVTRRGPVIIDQPGLTISLRTPTMVEDDLGFSALLPLLRSRTVDDVESALRHWVEPVNSAIVADRSGVVRHLVPGRVPVRDPENLDVPVPAWDARYAWSGGYAPMPVDPVDDLVANANDRASGGGLGNRYSPPWRAARILECLRQHTAVAPADATTMAAIHRDVRSVPAARAQRLIAAVEVSGPAKMIKDAILDWDGQLLASSRAALLYASWRSAMIIWLSDREPLSRLRDPEPLPAVFAATMSPTARLGLAFDAICANATRLGIDLGPAVIAALEMVAADPPEGNWGDHHRLAPVHGLTGLAEDHLPPLPDPALSGEANCVRVTASTPGVTHRSSMVSMARYVWDLADPAGSRWVVPFGASGAPDDPHYTDQADTWVAGDLVPVITDWGKLIKVE